MEPSTNEELAALGINPASPFTTCPRVKDAPLDIRVGDSRLRRYESGAVSVLIGYYSEGQELCRSAVGKWAADLLMETNPLLRALTVKLHGQEEKGR